MAHRTQLILDEWQYDGLRSLAESAGTSISSVVREAVSDYLARQESTGATALEELEGIVDDPGPPAREHDAVLYTGAAPATGRRLRTKGKG